jgi:hypothetical protein
VRWVRTAVVLAVLALAAPAAHSTGRLSLGVLGSPESFDHLTGQRSATRLIIAGWGQASFAQMFSTMGERPMLGLSSGTGFEAITSGAIAGGRGDDYLVELNHAVHEWARPIYIRPFGEMNGHWNTYCAYNQNGTPRDASHSTAAFRKAFARIYLAVHGDPAIGAKLRRLGLPAFRGGSLERNPNAIVVWNPQGYGSPDLPGNSAAAYYPGDAYVDVVGDDLYDIGFRPQWAAAQALYDAHPGKPFAFPEWGLWGIDDPGFVGQMASFLKTHRRTVLAVYYSGQQGSIFDLASKPRSLAAYRQSVAPLGR